MSTERFDFQGEDGETISGRLDLPDGPVTAYALFAHCFACTGDSSASSRIAKALTRLGFGVLRFDFTGLSQNADDSGSSFSGSVADIEAAAGALKAAGRAPTLLLGHSLGGAAVLAAAAGLPDMRAVVTISAPFDVADAERLYANPGEALKQGVGEVNLGGRPFRMRRSFVEELRKHDQGKRLAELRKPLLILHSPQDKVIGIDNAAAVFMAARHPKSFVSLDGADHLLSREEDAEFVASVVSGWSRRYLDAAPPRTAGQTGVVKVVETGQGNFQVEVDAGGVNFFADEPPEVGGLGSGPTPYDLLAAGLGACTAMTVRLYARSKKLPLEKVSVRVGHSRRADAEPRDLFTSRLDFEGDLDDAQRQKLLEIAGKCPVHRTLHAGAALESAEGAELVEEAAERPGAHAADRANLAGDPTAGEAPDE